MAARILYLEVDDEITSAAARIRDSDAGRLALVLPYGSRVATSRINFRLLSRDAMTHDKRLSIVSADSATRALAASAGLPVYGSVAEYEAAEGGEDAPAVVAASGDKPVAAVPVVIAAADDKPAEDNQPPADEKPAADEPAAAEDVPESDGTLGLVVPTATVAASASGVASTDTIRTAPMRTPAATTTTPPWSPPQDRVVPPVGAEPERPRGTTVAPRVAAARRIPVPWLIGGGILLVALLLAGFGAYTLLPSATIVVTPQPEAVGPIDLTIRADPTATQPDLAAAVVPAEEIPVPVSVDGTFPATGTRVDLTKATGTVRFENRDPTSTNRIPAGSIVRTASGVRFRTDATITVPRAELVGLTIFPARESVKVTAVDGGPEGNVAANTIEIVPSDEPSLFLKVTNPEPTTGGTRQEFTRVTPADVEAAMASLTTSLDAAFQDAIADPSLAPGDATVIPSTGVLGEPTPTVPPDSLVGKEVASFDLGLSATGTVLAVDTAPIETMAGQALDAAVADEHELIPGTTDIKVGEAVVAGQSVTFPVTATAQQIAILDPDELTALVLGKPIEEARRILEPYGTVDLSVSPDWSGSVPGFESRVDLTVSRPVEIASPVPSGSATP